MRPEGNPLDLNNFPDEHSRDGKQVHHESFSSGCRKKKSGVKDGKEECGKVYECRFCSLKFCKSQALGGHMNRHRQERETETLNHARQLVFRNDHNLTTQVAPRLGCCQQPIAPAGSYLPASNMGNPITPPKFPRYLSSNSSSINMPHPQQPLSSFPPQYPPVKDYYVGRVLSKMPQYGHHNLNYMEATESSYTCIGAPVGQAFAVGGGKDRSLHNQEEGLNWGRSYSGTQQGNLNPPSVINRFQDGF